MIEYLNGELAYKSLDYIVIDIQGIGYKVQIPFKVYEKLPKINSNVKIYIYTAMNEKEISYYGFLNRTEREVFETVLTADGIGPKKGLAILSEYTTEELVQIIKEDNVSLMTKVNGIGKNRAAVIIASLKNKFDKFIDIVTETNIDLEYLAIKRDVSLGLESLGYTKILVDDYITDDEIKELNDDTKVMKEILKRISANKKVKK